MKQVTVTEILEYYDGVQLFTAQDVIGGLYIGQQVQRLGDWSRYVVVGLRPKRLDDFRAGRVDLYTLILEMPHGEWYIAIPESDIDEPMALIRQYAPITDFDYLPDPGFTCADEPADPTSAVRTALKQGKTVAVTGQLQAADVTAGQWRLLTADGPVAGRTYPSGPTLHHLQIGRSYRFTCVQVNELGPLWENLTVLYLQSYSSEYRLRTNVAHQATPPAPQVTTPG